MTATVAPAIPSPSTFGPPLQNFGAIEDPSTQLDATAFNNMRAQLAMISCVSPIAMIAIQYQGGSVVTLRHSAVWGDTSGVVPTIGHGSTGNFTFTWATSYFDLRDDGTSETHAVNFRGAIVTPGAGGATKLTACYDLFSSRQVDVKIFNDAGALADPSYLTLVCW